MPRVTYQKVTEKQSLNDIVTRVKTSAWEVDLHVSGHNKLDISCECCLVISETQDTTADVVMRGTVFSKEGPWKIISCGGLLCKVSNPSLVIGKDYFVNLTLRKKREKRKAGDSL